MAAIHGKHSQVILTSTPSLSMTNLVLQDSGDHKTFTVPSASSSKRYWDNTASFTFQTSPDGTTWTNATPASVRYISGSITFASAVSGATPGARVATGKYLPWAALAWSDMWSADVSREVKEDTRFTTGASPVQYKTYVPALLGGTFKLSGFVVDDTVTNLPTITTDTPLIASMVLDVTTGARLECAGHLTKDSLKSPVGDLITEELDFQITGQVYLLTS